MAVVGTFDSAITRPISCVSLLLLLLLLREYSRNH